MSENGRPNVVVDRGGHVIVGNANEAPLRLVARVAGNVTDEAAAEALAAETEGYALVPLATLAALGSHDPTGADHLAEATAHAERADALRDLLDDLLAWGQRCAPIERCGSTYCTAHGHSMAGCKWGRTREALAALDAERCRTCGEPWPCGQIQDHRGPDRNSAAARPAVVR